MDINKRIKEELDSNVVRISCEDFKVIKSESGAKVVGIALPFNKVSRNQFTYVTESIQSARKTMENKPVLFNHDPDLVIGHNIASPITTEGLGYEVDINPKAINTRTQVPFVESIERGDLKKVSIQCIYDQDKSFTDESGITHAYINEFLEMSFVSIPGFEDTTAQLIESFKLKKTKGEMMETKKEESIKIPEVPAAQEKKELPVETKKEEMPVNKTETKQEQAPEEKPAKDEPDPEEPMNKIIERLSGIEGRIGTIEKWMEECNKPKEQAPKENKVVDEDQKREEAIKRDKQIISTEATQTPPKEITTKDLKKAFMEA